MERRRGDKRGLVEKRKMKGCCEVMMMKDGGIDKGKERFGMLRREDDGR